MNTERPERATTSIEEVAAIFGIARSTAYYLAKTDRLPIPVIRLGRRMVVSRAALAQVLESKSQAAEMAGGDRQAEVG